MNTAESLPEDAVYYLDYDVISTTHKSQYLKGIIDEHGYFEVNGTRVYTPALAAFLISETVEVRVIVREKYDRKETTVDNTVYYEHTLIREGENRPGVVCGCDYIASYTDGYAEGVKWFNETYAPGPTILYGPRADSYIATLHHLCFSEPFGFLHPGVVSVKGVMPVMIDHGGIKRIGYCSGIVAAIEKLVALHQPLFEQLQELKANIAPTDQKTIKEKKTEQSPALTPDELSLLRRYALRRWEMTSDDSERLAYRLIVPLVSRLNLTFLPGVPPRYADLASVLVQAADAREEELAAQSR